MNNIPPSNNPSSALSRRDFVRTAALAVSGAALGLKAAAAADRAPSVRPIIAFSKPFQSLGADEMAALVKEVGWDGIECPVRKKGQIEPERVGEELPRLVEAFRRQGLEIPVLVTDIVSMRQPQAEAVLRTASKLGIKRIRLGFIRYAADRPVLPQVAEIGGTLKEIGAACGELGIQAGVENHSGGDLFGAPIWDVHMALREAGVKNIGYCFDIAHATIEGGLSWPIQARLVEPDYTAVYIKDFNWAKTPQGWRPAWCPLGEGMVSRSYVARLKQIGYSGPLCQHHEYPLGERAQMIALMRRDLQVLRDWLA
jgi:sugar phosphate isomerase/epimerase